MSSYRKKRDGRGRDGRGRDGRGRDGRERDGRGRDGRGRGGLDRGFEIYNAKFKEEIGNVIKNVEKENTKFNRPNREELKKIENVVLKIIAKRKLKLYGGWALNYFMPSSNKIYEEDIGNVNDYDIYCIDAFEEGKYMADVLYKAGIEYVSLGVGGFGNNYKLFCSFEEIANFTGLDKKLFDIIPVNTDKKSGVSYVMPEYLKMDLIVSLVNPRISLWRWIKDYERKLAIDKHYPIVKPTNCKWPELSNKDKLDAEDLKKFIEEDMGRGILYTGFSALGMFHSVGETGTEGTMDKPKFIMTEIMAQNIKDIIDKLMKKFGNKAFIYKVEEDPLHILPKRFVVYGKLSGTPLLMIYSLLEHCVPYVTIADRKCVSVDYLMLYFQVNMYLSMMRLTGESTVSDVYIKLYKCALYGVKMMRENYLSKNKLTVFDKSPYQMHIIKCFGNFVNPYYQAKVLKWEKKLGGTYVPAKEA